MTTTSKTYKATPSPRGGAMTVTWRDEDGRLNRRKVWGDNYDRLADSLDRAGYTREVPCTCYELGATGPGQRHTRCCAAHGVSR